MGPGKHGGGVVQCVCVANVGRFVWWGGGGGSWSRWVVEDGDRDNNKRARDGGRSRYIRQRERSYGVCKFNGAETKTWRRIELGEEREETETENVGSPPLPHDFQALPHCTPGRNGKLPPPALQQNNAEGSVVVGQASGSLPTAV